jgi:hypothetical protein
VHSGAGWLNESVFHWIDGGTLSTLSVFEDKVEGNCAVVATNAYKGILEVVYIRESKFISKKIGVSVAGLRVYTAISR